MSFSRWSSPSLKISQSVTTVNVRSAIMGMASTTSVRASTVRVLPSKAWSLNSSKPAGMSFLRSSPR